MKANLFPLQNHGMSRDLSVSKAENTFAWENYNVRITAREGDTLLSITNERGPKRASYTVGFEGILLGWNVLGDNLILFVHSDIPSVDTILRIYITESGSLAKDTVFTGGLSFDGAFPIESVVAYESEEVQKIYWVDGKNVLRSCNFMQSYTAGSEDPYTGFDSDRGTKNTLSLSIEKDNGGSSRPNGTVQYFVTAYDKFGVETGILASSSLVYLSPFDRGGAADESNTNRVTLTITSSGTVGFGYLRVYSIVRTSYNGTMTGYIVGEYPLSASGSSTVVAIDSGANYLGTIDVTKLLYIGSKSVVPNAIEQKDNTLFLGNLKVESNDYTALDTWASGYRDEETGECNGNYISFVNSKGSTPFSFDIAPAEDTYAYRPQLDHTSDDIKIFKGGEKYRFAVVFSKANGERSKAFWVGDKVCDAYPVITNGTISYSVPKLTISTGDATDLGYDYAQLYIAQATYADRKIKAQGFLNPTVYNLYDRYNNQPYARPSWMARPAVGNVSFMHLKSLKRSDNKGSELQSSWWETSSPRSYYTKDNNGVINNYIPEAWTNRSDTTEELDGYTGVRIEMLWSRNSSTFDVDWFYYGRIELYRTNISNPLVDAQSTDWENFRTVTIRDREGWLSWNDFSRVVRTVCEGDPVVRLYFDPSIEQLNQKKNEIALSHTSSWTNEEAYNEAYEVSSVITDLTTAETFCKYSRQHYFVDSNIVTMHSPEIEYEQINIDKRDDLQLHIVGAAPISASITDLNMQVVESDYVGNSIIKPNYTTPNLSYNTYGTLTASPVYYDSLTKDDEDGITRMDMGRGYYMSYLLHKTGSIIGYTTSEGKLVADLITKRFANMQFAYFTSYVSSLDDVYNATETDPLLDVRQVTGYSTGVYEFNTMEGSRSYGVNVPATVVMPPDFKYPLHYAKSQHVRFSDPLVLYNSASSSDPVTITYNSRPHLLLSLPASIEDDEVSSLMILPGVFGNTEDEFDPGTTQEVYLGWSDTLTIDFDNVQQGEISLPSISTSASYLLVGELCEPYDDFSVDDKRYGGITPSAIQNNVFIPCGEPVKMDSSTVTLYGTEGDTFLQRYDCVMSYPQSENDVNQILDIASVMLETHVCLDGRTDKDRGVQRLADIDYTSFGNINPAYQQENNILSAMDYDDKFNQSLYETSVAWSLEKHPLETTDTWMNVNLASTMSLDPANGQLRSINKFKNTLLAFQDKAISEIMFNSRVQIPVSDGVPVEIANSGKCDGSRIISNHYGCLNKWSIVEGKSGLYFKDDLSKVIAVFNENGIDPLSSKAKLDAWVRSSSATKPWTPINWENTVAYYDKINSDVYFVNSENIVVGGEPEDNPYPCLVYNEQLGSFTGFFSYGSIPMMLNFGTHFVCQHDSGLYYMNEGYYNHFFDEYKDSYVIWRVTPEPYGDKLWTNIDYRADFTKVLDANGDLEYKEYDLPSGGATNVYQPDVTIDSLRVWNEYQDTGDFRVQAYNYDKYPDVRKKFRVWRADIPRDSNDSLGLDRIRNPWVFLKISKSFGTTDDLNRMRMEIHDMVVKYYTNE